MLKRENDGKLRDVLRGEFFLILTLILFIMTQFNGCSQREDTTLSPLRQVREDGSIVQHSIVCSLNGDTLVVTHQDAYYQCCLEAKILVHKADYSIDIVEYDVGQPCDCMCYFDLTTALVGLPQGTYTIKVWNENGEFYGGCDATILKEPRLACVSQSECVAYPKVTRSESHEDSIGVVHQGDTLTVTHYNAFYNCCFHIDVDFEQNGPILNFIEHPGGDPCLCMCYFDITSTVVGLAPGTYRVRVWNDDLSFLFGEVEFTISSETTAKTLAVPEEPSPSRRRWRYRSTQIGCKEYPKKILQQQ